MSRLFEKSVWGGASRNGRCLSGIQKNGARRVLTALLLAAVISVTCAATPAAANPLEDFGNWFMGLFSADAGVSAAAAGAETNKVADDDSTKQWEQAIGDADASTPNTGASGRVWTDKSVFTDKATFGGALSSPVTVENDSDFLVSYSLLSSSTKVSGQTQVPVDVVFALDTSWSMAKYSVTGSQESGQTRIAAAVDAINMAIEQLMQMNPNNRVAVVGFSNSGNAKTLFPLGHYTKINDADYFSLSRKDVGGIQADYRMTYNGMRDKNNNVNGTVQITGGTNTQYAIEAATDVLLNATNLKVTLEDGSVVNRVPMMVLMSDGAPVVSSSSGEWWNPGTAEQGVGSNDVVNYAHAMKAMMLASYKKAQVNEHYGAQDGSAYDMGIFTIGVGLEQLTNESAKNLARATLNPAEYLDANTDEAKTLKSAWESYLTGGRPQLRYGTNQNNVNQTANYTFTHPSAGDITTLNYADKYYDTSNADQLLDAFKDIVSNISMSVPTPPTAVGDAGAMKSGYVTYTDPIGEYMEVKDLKEIIYNNHEYKKKNDPVQNDKGGYTYTFTETTESPIYGNQNLSEILINTQVDENGQQSLVIQVPAALIPMRINEVQLDADGNVESHEITNNAYPMRILYTVGFKDDVLMKDDQGNVIKDEQGKTTVDFSKISEDYIKANAVKDDKGNPTGDVYFYSNDYKGTEVETGEQAGTRGEAYAEFMPAGNNPFYYIQDEIELTYADGSNKGQLVKDDEFDLNASYTFSLPYYQGNEIKQQVTTRTGKQLAQMVDGKLEGVVKNKDGVWCVAPGTPRMANLLALSFNKGGEYDNPTQTATYMYYPSFVGDTLEDGGFRVYLGNNGRVSVGRPGELTITKTAKIANTPAGLVGPQKQQVDESDQPVVDAEGNPVMVSALDDQEFPFELTLKNADNTAVDGTFTAQKFKDGKAVGEAMTVGNGTQFTLKNGETLHVYGLSKDMKYSVAEKAYDGHEMPAGFTQTDPVDESGKAVAGEGTISAGVTSEAAFTNEYTADPVTVSDDNFKYQKKFGQNDEFWEKTPDISFDFWLIDNGNNAGLDESPFPEGTKPEKVTVGGMEVRRASVAVKEGNKAGTFGSIEFTQPGTYHYEIYEKTPDESSKVLGVIYSNEAYDVTVVVSDNGSGKLSAEAQMVKHQEGDAEPVPADTAVITNDYSLTTAAVSPLATKIYTDKTGDTTLGDLKGSFTFLITPLTDGAPEPMADGKPLPKNEDGAYYTTNTSSGSISLGTATFTDAHVGHTYTYQIKEQAGSTLNMAYSKAEYYVHVTVSSETGADGGTVIKTAQKITATDDPNGDEIQLPNKQMTFENVYEAAPTETTLEGRKTLTGRDWKDGEQFNFTLVPTDAKNDVAYSKQGKAVSTKDALEKEKTVVIAANGDKAAAAKPADGSKVSAFKFGDITFKHTGKYTFLVTEDIPDAAKDNKLNGLTYDSHTATVTVKVVDDRANGTLKVESVTYANTDATGADATEKNLAAFTNEYHAKSAAFTGLEFSKKLTGRDLKANEFTFEVSGAKGTKRELNTEIKNPHNHKDGDKCTIATAQGKKLLEDVVFTEEDLADSPYVYTVNEVIPQGATPNEDGSYTLNGVTYDQAKYTVTVTLADDGNGTITATTAWTDAGGNPMDKVVFKNTYTPSSTTINTDENPSFVKSLRNRPWAENETFTFTLTRDDASFPMPTESVNVSVSGDTVTVTIGQDRAGKWGFDTIPFTAADMRGAKEKTFTYTVREVMPDGATSDNQYTVNGTKYDNTARELSITIVDDGSGALKLKDVGISTAKGNTFYNDYSATIDYTAKGGLDIVKTLVGHNLAKNQFSFMVQTDDANTASKLFGKDVHEDAEWNDAFEVAGELPAKGDGETSSMSIFGSNKVTFDQSETGDYTFDVWEKLPDGLQADENGQYKKDGYTYDATKHTVKITVEDNYNGVLTVTTYVDDQVVATYKSNEDATTTAQVAFTNYYNATGTLTGATDLKGTKKIDGPWAGDKAGFKFSIKQVADKNGAELGENDVRAILPTPAEATSDEDGNFNFGDITFTKPGTYYFQVEESAGLGGDGWTNSTEKKIVKVTVTEADTGNGNGKLVAAKDASSDKLEFTNRYAQTPSEAYTPQVIKKVVGHAAEKEQFEFKLEAADQTTKDAIKNGDIKSEVLEGDTTSETQKNAAGIADNGTETISFAGMTFTKVSPDGGYTFKVTESHKEDDNKDLDGVQNAGWMMDTHEYTITITVTDVNSQLVVHAADADGKTFSNTFGAATTLGANGGFKVTKQLTGRDLEQDQFNFTIKATEGTDNHDAAAEKLAEIEGVTDGVLNFKNSAPNDKGVAEMKPIDGLAFDQNDIGKTFAYTVSEVDEEATHSGYTYDKESATVAITVHEGEGGKIYTTIVVTKGGKSTTYESGKTAEVPFKNSYAAEGDVTITANKILTGRTMKPGEFTFGIVAKGGKTDGSEDAATGTNDADGKIVFSAINYTADGLDKLEAKENSYVEKTEINGKRAWKVSYTAYEKTPLPAGVTAKTDPIDFTVTVVDEGNGTMSATANVPETGLAFENVYGGDSAEVAIAGKKVLAGDVTNKPDITGKYTFTIVKGDGTAITNGDEDFKNTAANDKDGNVTFQGKLVYTMDDLADIDPDANGVRIKEFTYKVTETETEGGGVPGVTTDGEKTVTVALKDDGKGKLTATVSGDPDFTFTNTYAPAAATHAPVVKKELKGDRGVDLQAGEFSFEMSVAAKDGSPKDGYTLPEKTTVTNKADGTVTFDNISFTKEGTYTVTIKEQVPADGDKAPYMEYDEHSYSYDVVVTSDGTGELQIDVKGAPTDKDATFTNTYNKPEQEKNAYQGDGTELKTNINGQMVGVGDLITYKIDWFNDAVNPETGASAAAKIVVTDSVPTGTEFVSASDGGQLVNGAVTWNLNEQAPGAHGTVTMTVRVLDSAVSVDKITNQANINVGGHDAKTDEVTNFIPKKTVGDGKPTVEGDIQVGDRLTYTIEWANTTGSEADVVVTDELSDGLTFVEASDPGTLGKDKQTVTWNLGKQAAGASGKVTVTVQVNEKAVVPGADNSNKATINVGNSSNVTTNTVPGPQLQTGALAISKTVVSSDAGVDAPAQDFTFNVELKDKNGDPLTGEYGFAGTSDGSAPYSGKVSNGGTIVLKDKGAITIEGLPEGATYKVTETIPEGWAASFGNAGDHGAIAADGTANVAVTNTYKPGSIALPGADSLKVQKVLDGDRDWLADEKYTFEISAVNPGDAPMPEQKTLELSKPAKGKTQSGNFGNIAFTQTGTYEYKIVEKGTSADSNLTFSQAEYKVVVTVGQDATDSSKLAVSSVMTQVKNDQGETTETAVNNSTAVFTNTYAKPDQKKDVFAGADVDDLKTSINGKLVGVGDEITYKIDWVNNAVDDKGEAAAATVVVTDKVPQGTELVASSDGGQKQDDGSVVWNLGEQPANASGSVTMTVKVTDDAVDVDKIKNTAEIKIGDNDPEQTNEVENDFPKKTVQTPTEGSVRVGDILTYTVEWANTTGQTADVVVNDTFMAGLQLLTGEGDYAVTGADGKEVTFEAKSAPVVGGPSTTTATVTIKDVEPGASGTVVFKAKVTEDALSVDKITNTAAITVGDKSTVTTNTTTTPAPKKGDLTVTKTVTAGEGAEVDNSKEFDFTVTAKDASNNNLNGTYGKLVFVDGTATFKLKNGGEEKITGLPEGTQYTVTEAAADGYTTTATGDTGTIAAGKEAKADFVNTYSSAVPVDKPVTVNGLLTKRFTGRTWNENDEFTFKIEAKDPTTAPMPEKTEVTVKGDGQSETQPIDFGTINFTFDDIKDVAPDENGKRTKTFTYDVYEVVPEDAAKIPGVTYDTHHATITVTLTDNGDGTMGGSSEITAITRAVNNEFHNVYTTDVNYTAVTGIDLQKTLTGRDMTDGQFAFTLSNFSDGAAKKLGLSDAENAYTVKGAKSGEASTIDLFAGKTLTFTDGDAGNTYTFNVRETKVGGTGYTNDTAVRHVAIAVTYDKATGVLTVTTTVTKDGESKPVAQTVVTSETEKGERAVIPFGNSYEASTESEGGAAATIEATKSLTGRPLEDGEFAFTLTGPGLDVAGKTVRNQGDKVSFGTFNYTSSDLEAMVDGTTVKRITTEDGKRGWELGYTASEVTDGFADTGLTANRQNFPVTVTVVDNGDGSLTASAAYPGQGGNVFQNTYNASEVQLSLSGKKVLDHADNLKPNSIEGKFTFALTDAAGKELGKASNGADGSVEFVNKLTYTLDELNKLDPTTSEPAVADAAEGETAGAAKAASDEGIEGNEGIDAQTIKREWLFTYYVTESGNADGVTNDPASKKEIKVKVTDDGKGRLSAAVVKDDKALDFSFTNTYTVQPVASSITDQLSIGKTIDGREMQAGEFDFAMVDAAGNTVAGGDNDQAGTSSTVTFTPVQFTEPGEHDYTVREVNSGKGGVSYDSTSYQAHASVKDNGNGTLSVAWTVSKGDEPVTEGVVFNNTYEAKPTSIAFNAAKVLTGRDLKAGEFSFQLLEDGKVLQTVKNGADGDAAAIAFDTITYDEVGEHDYEIVEVKGDDATITYDKTTFTYHVSVTDDGNGSLVATWTAGENGDPVFRNVYTEPAKPEKPTGPELPQTGDPTPPTGVLATIAAFGAALVGGGVALIKRRR